MLLLTRIIQFCDDRAIPPTRFGRLAVSDPRLIGDLRRGRHPGPGMIARVERFMAEYRA